MARPGNIVGGKYRILQRIGEGSMGSVWKAEHVTLGRPFAVKFLKQYDDNADRVQDRFLAEARRAAAVRHRCVVDVVDFGRTDEGTPYMVMEYLDGVSLAQRLRDGPLPTVRELLRIMQQALAGLDAVHRAGVLHRDLKPENIVLCPEGDQLVAKLVDFGISKDLQPPQVDDQGNRLTSPGTTVGTPWYMAPEQVQGLPTIDQRSDVYAAAVILYEAITGRLPFEHDDLQMVLLMVAAGGATRVSNHRQDLPLSLSDVIEKAMAVDPDHRHASAGELATALRGVMRDISPLAVCVPRMDAAPGDPPPERPDDTTHEPGVGGDRLPQESADEPVDPPEDITEVRLPVSRTPTLPIALAGRARRRMPAGSARAAIMAAGGFAIIGALALVGVLLEAPPVAEAHRPASARTGLVVAPAATPAAQHPPVTTAREPRELRTLVSTTGAATAGLAAHGGPGTTDAATASEGRRPAVQLADAVTATSAESEPVKPRKAPRAGTRRPPEIFRDPGF